MQAMILAAGKGTRLLPVTRYIPKPLFPVLNIPSILRLLSQLESAGFTRVLINTFHLTGQMLRALKHATTGMEVVTLTEPVLLGTGGALRNAAQHMGKGPVFLINSDVVTDIDFRKLWDIHLRHGASATMFMHERPPWNNVMVKAGLIRAFGYSGENALAFTGISVLEKTIVDHVPETVPSSLVEAMNAAIADKEKIQSVRLDKNFPGYLWEDIGTVKGYLDAHQRLIAKEKYHDFFTATGSSLPKGTILKDWLCMGKNVTVREGCILGRTVLWDNVRLEPGQDVRNCVVTPFGILREEEPP